MANPAIAAAAISGGGSILTSGLNYMFNRKLAKYQYELDQQAIDRQNAYNSPIQQMARYKEAGLNPNMIYGSGGSAGNQTEIARFDAPRVNFDNPLQGALSSYFDARLKTAQEEHLKQQAEYQKALASHEAAKELHTLLMTNRDKLQFQYDKETYDERVRSILLKNQDTEAGIQLKHDQSARERKQIDVMDSTIKQINQNIKESNQRIKESDQRITESEKRIEKMGAELQTLIWRAKILKQDWTLNDQTFFARKDKIINEADLSDYAKALEQFYMNYRNEFGYDPRHTNMFTAGQGNLKRLIEDNPATPIEWLFQAFINYATEHGQDLVNATSTPNGGMK